MEVKDQCVATVRHVNQLQQHINEEDKKVAKFVSPHSHLLTHIRGIGRKRRVD
jgi:hypothetical protein